MRRYLQYIISSVSVLSLLFVTTSCEHKDLCYNHPHGVKLKVEFDWEKAPDAFAKGMCIYFYPEDGGSYRRFDFSNMQGGYIELTAGTYNVICYNNDTDGVLFSGISKYHNQYLYTRNGNLFEPVFGSAASSTPRADGTEDERVVITPDMMWGCAVTKVYVAETGVSYTHETITGDMDSPQLKVENTKEDIILTFYPEELLCHYTYEIKNIENIEEIDELCGSLSSMSGGMKIYNGELSRECVTLPFSAKINIEENIITGEFYTFGHHEENMQPHRMILYAWMKDGNKYYYGGSPTEEKKAKESEFGNENEDEDKFNVTDQIHNAPDKRHVHIIIDGVSFPERIHNGSGYQPSVDDWTNEYHDIYM